MNAVLRQRVSTWPIAVAVAASTTLWFAVMFGTSQERKGLAANLSDLALAVALGCPFLNLMLAAALLWTYAREGRASGRIWLWLAPALVVAFLPWVWILAPAFAEL